MANNKKGYDDDFFEMMALREKEKKRKQRQKEEYKRIVRETKKENERLFDGKYSSPFDAYNQETKNDNINYEDSLRKNNKNKSQSDKKSKKKTKRNERNNYVSSYDSDYINNTKSHYESDDNLEEIKPKKPKRKLRFKQKKKKERKKKSFFKRFVAFLTALLILFISLVSFCGYKTVQALDTVNYVDFPKNPNTLGINEYVLNYYKDKNYIKNIALFGTDARPGEKQSRADSIMIASFNLKTGEIKLSSILRDTYIKLDEENGFDKINAAYSYGGPSLAVKTINQNFDMNISDFITVDFGAIVNIVDTIGGVTVNVKDTELKQLNKYIRENNKLLGGQKSPEIQKGGDLNLDGKQALSFCRIRYVGNGDYDRAKRQKVVLQAIYDKIKADKNPILLYKVLKSVCPNLTTSIKGKNFWPYIYTFVKSKDKPQTYCVDNDKYSRNIMRNGISYVGLKYLKENVILFHEFVYTENGVKPAEYKPSEFVLKRDKELRNRY